MSVRVQSSRQLELDSVKAGRALESGYIVHRVNKLGGFQLVQFDALLRLVQDEVYKLLSL
jgi:hypothetical protein